MADYCEVERLDDYGNPKGTTIEIEYNYRPGYFISNPRNEAEYLDPGCPDEMEIISAVILLGKRTRKINLRKCSEQTTTYLENCVWDAIDRR